MQPRVFFQLAKNPQKWQFDYLRSWFKVNLLTDFQR